MTLQQLRYVVAVAEKGTISEAAQELYLSQPSMTSAIRELEQELNLTIFNRTNRGVVPTREGEQFLGYARQVLDQVGLLEEKYTGKKPGKQQFCVSTQHYSFAVDAFVDLIRSADSGEYDFHLRETQTYEIIEDVSHLRSEVGILYLNSFNEKILRRTLRENDLRFERLFTARPHVFVSSSSVLARKSSVTLKELEEHPYLSFEQGEHNSFYFSEEILSTLERKKNIRVRDRATLFNLLIGLDGYTICSGVINEALNGRNITAVPLEADDRMEIGCITHRRILPGKLGTRYLEALRRHTQAFREEKTV